MASEKKDFVIYGASGFTGQYVVREVIKKCQIDKKLSWAVAGRSRDKVSAALKSAETELGEEIPTLIVKGCCLDLLL